MTSGMTKFKQSRKKMYPAGLSQRQPLISKGNEGGSASSCSAGEWTRAGGVGGRVWIESDMLYLLVIRRRDVSAK